ncbi:MAG: BACON domain-containing protein [Aristaeellaceae bacterium]
MKIRRLAALALLLMLLAGCQRPALAEAVLAMPASLRVIEAEAFCGSAAIDSVVLPEGIQEIRSRAFADSSLSEINLPASLTFIADDAFDGLETLKISATPDTYAYQWAVGHGYLAQVIEATGFSVAPDTLTLHIGSACALTPAFEPDDATATSVAWDSSNSLIASVSDGLVTARAEGAATITAVTENGLSAACAVTVVRNIPAPVLSPAEQNGMGTVTLTWSGLERGYAYLVYEQTGDTLTLLGTTTEHSFSAHAVAEGTHQYCVQACIHNGDGILISSAVSEPCAIDVQYVWTYGAALEKLGQTAADTVSITWRGVSPVSSYEIAEIISGSYLTVASGLTSDTAVVSSLQPGVHHFAIRAVYEDDSQHRWVSDWSAQKTVQVVEAAVLAPEAPVLQAEGPAGLFAAAQADAAAFVPQRFELAWEAVDNAVEYGVRLWCMEDADWSLRLRDTTRTPCYSLSEAVLAEADGERLFRLDLSSVNVLEGELRSYYFIIRPETVSEDLTVNGSAGVIWNQASMYASARVFDIASELPWTATEDASWLSLSVHEQQLTVFMDAYETDVVFADPRTATVTVSNGVREATITITQDASTWARIEEPALSQDEANPTVISTSGIRFDHRSGGNDVVIVLYERQQDGRYAEICRMDNIKNTYTIISSGTAGVALKHDTLYKAVIMNVYSSATYRQYEVEDDILCTGYYMLAMDDASFVTANGCTECDVLMEGTSASVTVAASGVYTWSADADWLSFGTSLTESKNVYGTLSIRATDNDTASSRVGHVTLRSGAAEAVVTVTQASTLPRLTFPEGISESESAPTVLPYGFFRYEACAAQALWYKDDSGAFTLVEDLGYTSNSHGAFSDYVDPDSAIEPGALYRLTLLSGEHERHYYVQFASARTANEVLLDGSIKPASWTIPSTAYTRAITVQGDASWTASSSASWLKIAATGGSTTQITTTVTASANTTGRDRSAVILFQCGGISVSYIAVTQRAEDYVDVHYGSSGVHPLLAADTAHLSGKTQSCTLRVYAGANWSITSSVDWIGFDGSSFKKSSSSLSNVAPNRNVKLWLAENPYGSAARSGQVTITSGSASYTLTVSQEPNLAEPVLNDTDLSDDYTNPSIYQYDRGDMTLNWNAVQGATLYEVSLTCDLDTRMISNSILVPADGSASYTVTIPQKWLHPEADDYHYIILYACDDYGHELHNQYSFYVHDGDAVYLDGSNEPVWSNASDLACSCSWAVTSTAAWSAVSDADWITLSPASGASGDTLTVHLAQNSGEQRTGTVRAASGNAGITLTVTQCAAIPEYPALDAPAYSTDKSNPTLIPAATTAITARWTPEPQATRYTVSLMEYSATSAGHVVASSGALYRGEAQYTFSDLALTEGQLYWIKFLRTNNGRSTATSYYFVAGNDDAFVTLDGETAIDYEDDAFGSGSWYRVASSGVWSASSDSSWLTVGRTYIDEDYLLEHGDTADEHLVHYGQHDDLLYVYMFPNETASSRAGTVTVRTGSAVATIRFLQEKPYTVASLISPTLAGKPSAAGEIGYGPLTLSWSASSSGTGRYEVLLYEADSRTASARCIYRRQGITARSLTIPQSTLTEGKFYRLWLGSEIEEGDDYDHGSSYYFTMGYQNELSVSATADWSQVNSGGSVSISAAACGGAGGYSYAYQLLLDGVIEQQTPWETLKYYQFRPWSNGSYQVRVLVQDADGRQAEWISSYTKEDDSTISVAAENHYAADVSADCQFLDYAVLSPRTWSIVSCPEWITPSVTGECFDEALRLLVTRNDGVGRTGVVAFRSNTGICSDLTITQRGSRMLALAASEGTYAQAAQTVTLAFDAAAQWTASSDSTWAAVSSRSGAGGSSTLTIQLAEYTGSGERTAVITLLCDDDAAQYTIHQLGEAVVEDAPAEALQQPVFVYPAQRNDVLPLDDVSFAWTAAGAQSCIISLRDLTTGQLIIYHENVGEATAFTLPASTWISGHQYRIAVGASQEALPSIAADKKWTEQLFFIADADECATELYGIVLSANDHLLSGVTVTVKNDEDRIIATATTDSMGGWSVPGVYRGETYTVSYAKPGYIFASDRTVQSSGSATLVEAMVSDNAFDDEAELLTVDVDAISLGSDESSAEMYIASEGSWEISADVSWLTFSSTSGSGNAWVLITADANADAEPGSDDRTATITITQVSDASSASLLRLSRAYGSYGQKKVTVSQNSPTLTMASGSDQLAENGKYTGIPVTGAYTHDGKLTISRDMDLTGGQISVDGDIIIKARVVMCTGSKLVATGKIEVQGNGILDMRDGGLVYTDGDFIFDSGKDHSSYLTGGVISVGGDVDIKCNFRASAGNQFVIRDNGKQHRINMHGVWFWQKEQCFGTLDAQAPMTMLVIKHQFDAQEAIWNYKNFQKYHSGSPFTLLNPYVFGQKTLSIDSESNARIQMGILRMMAEHGKTKTYAGIPVVTCEYDDYYAYIRSDGTVGWYHLSLNMSTICNDATGMGTGDYSDDSGNVYHFSVTSSYEELPAIIREFAQFQKKYVLSAVTGEIQGLAVDCAISTALEIIPMGSDTKTITKAMANNWKELANIFSILNE